MIRSLLLVPLVAAPVVFEAAADRTEVSLGDRVTITYTARIPAGAALTLDALVTPEPPEGKRPPGGAVLEFEAPPPPVVQKTPGADGKLGVTQKVSFVPFLPGTVVVPGPHFTFEEETGGGKTGRSLDVRPPSVTLQVSSRLPKDAAPEKLAPKEDRPVRLPRPSPLFWAALGALALLLVGAAVWAIRRRRRKSLEMAEAPSVPPGEELLGELERLEREAERLGEDPRTFYADLTRAVKRYLERRLEMPVLEWTSFETVRRLREKELEPPREVGFAELLSSADYVKFGRGRSTRDAARDQVARARKLHGHLEARLAPSPVPGTEKAS